NGDLLNSHLVNWSSGSGRRRSTVVLSIAHGADLTLIKEGVLNILLADDRILKHPEASLFFQDMNADALELHFYYWTRQTKILGMIKSDVLVAVNQFFISHKIKVPYPKQEVFIHPDKEKK
ncbi:MAG: mechanosensitive ion channel, partial [Chitinophagaceae bacterium]